jgi:hypothetical protein
VTFGAGTAASVAIDVGLLTRDVYEAVHGVKIEDEDPTLLPDRMKALTASITNALNELMQRAPALPDTAKEDAERIVQQQEQQQQERVMTAAGVQSNFDNPDLQKLVLDLENERSSTVQLNPRIRQQRIGNKETTLRNFIRQNRNRLSPSDIERGTRHLEGHAERSSVTPETPAAVQQMDAGGRETSQMMQEQPAVPESLVSPMSYAATGVRQEQLPSNISSILQLLSGVEFHSIKIEAKSIEFDGSVRTAEQASVDQYATRIAAPAAGPMPAPVEMTPESTSTPSAAVPSAGSSAPASRSASRPAPGGSGMLSRLGRSIFGGGGGGSSSPSAGSPSAQQTAAAPATPSIGGGGGGGGAGASSGTITEVVERGPGFNVVKYDDGKVERRTGARNWRNNNPGNIEFGDFARRQGAIGTDGRFAIFPTYEAGKRAKEALLFEGRNYSGLTIAQAITRYAPPSENDTAMYIRVAAGAVGVSPSTPMKDLDSGQRQALLAAMERVEGFRVGNVQVIQEGTAVAAAEQAPPGPGPTLAAEGAQMAAADQAQMRGQGQEVVVQVPPASAPQRIAAVEQQAPTGRGEVSLNRRLEKQVA